MKTSKHGNAVRITGREDNTGLHRGIFLKGLVMSFGVFFFEEPLEQTVGLVAMEATTGLL